MRYRMSLPISVVLLAALWGGGSPATAASTPSVSAEPSSVALGETTTITASGLGGLETATFGLGETDSGAFAGDGVETGAGTAVAPVSAQTAVVQFTPTRSGDVVVAVGSGESVLARVIVSVSGATAEPSPATADPAPSPTSPVSTAADAQAEPDPEAEAGRFTFVLIPLIAAAVVVIGGIFVVTRGRRKRRGD